MNKKCQSCGEMKSVDEFHRRTKAPDGRQSRCKTCNREQRKAYYKTAYGKSKNDLTGKRWAEQMRRKVFDYLLSHPCVDCGEADPVVLEFDHRDDAVKSGNVCTMIGHYGWEAILIEIEKCEVRCANCHRRRTARQFGWSKLAWATT